MFVKIGAYRTWFGVYQLAYLLEKVGVSHDKCHELGDKAPQWLVDFTEWLHSKKKREIVVRIDNYDTWNAHNTLSLIVTPLLKKMAEDKHGAPYTEDADVPEGLGLRRTEAPPKVNEYDFDENHWKRWDWILNEMIYAHECQNNDWEDKYHSGVIDFTTRKTKTGTNVLAYGPEHTHKCDYEGMKKEQARISNGLRLFGKYYENLWT